MSSVNANCSRKWQRAASGCESAGLRKQQHAACARRSLLSLLRTSVHGVAAAQHTRISQLQARALACYRSWDFRSRATAALFDHHLKWCGALSNHQSCSSPAADDRPCHCHAVSCCRRRTKGSSSWSSTVVAGAVLMPADQQCHGQDLSSSSSSNMQAVDDRVLTIKCQSSTKMASFSSLICFCEGSVMIQYAYMLVVGRLLTSMCRPQGKYDRSAASKRPLSNKKMTLKQEGGALRGVHVWRGCTAVALAQLPAHQLIAAASMSFSSSSSMPSSSCDKLGEQINCTSSTQGKQVLRR